MHRFFRDKWFWGYGWIPSLIISIPVFGAVVMLLWNALLPDIAGLPAINYLQAVGLLALTRILVGRGAFGWTKLMERGRGYYKGK